MTREANEFNKTRRYLKTYLVKWDEITFKDKVVVTPKERHIIANSFLDCLAKTELLHRCNAKDLLSIEYINTVTNFGENE